MTNFAYHLACAADPFHVWDVLKACERGILAERRQPGSTPVRESRWQARLDYWRAQAAPTRRAPEGQATLFDLTEVG